MNRKDKPASEFIIVTKKPVYDFNSMGGSEDVPEHIKEEFEEVYDKTFWIYEKDGTFIGRYSVKSAPAWIMQVYGMIVN